MTTFAKYLLIIINRKAMKRHFVTIIALLGFCMMANATTVTKTYDYNFNGIDVSDMFDITLVKADVNSVTVELDSEYVPYLSVTASSGVLKVCFKRLPVKLKLNRKAFKLTICTPMVNYIVLSGACKLSCNDTFSLGMNNFRATVSGASTISSLRLKTIDASVKVSGASKVFIDGEFSDFEAQVEGASRLTLDGSVSDLDAKVTGSSELKVSGTVHEVDVNVKGASKAELVGEGRKLEAEVIGASKLSAADFRVLSAEIEAAGASTVTVNASASLKAKISGASTCRYADYPDLRIFPEVRGGATFRTL